MAAIWCDPKAGEIESVCIPTCSNRRIVAEVVHRGWFAGLLEQQRAPWMHRAEAGNQAPRQLRGAGALVRLVSTMGSATVVKHAEKAHDRDVGVRIVGHPQPDALHATAVSCVVRGFSAGPTFPQQGFA